MKKLGIMVLLQKDDKMLFLIRKKENEQFHQQGIYLAMGGKVEDGESIEEAAIRETYEESGIKINSMNLRAVLYSRTLPESKFDDWTNFLFISEDFSGEPKDGNEGTFEWVPVGKILTLHLYEGIRVFLEHVLKSDFLVMESNHDGYKLLDYKILKSY